MKKSIKYLFLSVVGGGIYCMIEILFRSYSHWTMFVLGGVCFIALGLINEIIPWEMPLPLQMLIGAGIVTALEFVTGLIVNVGLNWHVWDYSNLPLNLMGQICLPFSLIWYFISAVGITLDDYLRYWFFNEEKPRYKLV